MSHLTLEWVPLTELEADVPPGPYGTFARYLAHSVVNGRGPAVGGGAERCFAVSGAPLGHPEVSFAWLFGTPGPTLEALVMQLLPMMPRPMLAFPLALEPTIRSAGLKSGRDALLVHDGALPPEPGYPVVPLDPVHDRPRVVESLRDKLPPPQLIERVDFQYLGIEQDDEVVALLETTVDDGTHAVIQQVFTDPRRLRTGLGKALVAGVVRRLRAAGRVPVYVVSSTNEASAALAASVGFRLEQRLGIVES